MRKKSTVLKILSTLLLLFAVYNQFVFSFYYSRSTLGKILIGFLSIASVAVLVFFSIWKDNLIIRKVSYILYSLIGLIFSIIDFQYFWQTMEEAYLLFLIGAVTDFVVGLLLFFSAKKFNIAWGCAICFCLYMEWISANTCLLIQIPLLIACMLANIIGKEKK